MNIIQVAGHLGADAETRFTPSGQKVTTLRVATNVRRGGKEDTIWWRVTLWGERFDKILPYLKKGSAVIIVGEMGKPEIWTDRDGNSQVTLEITCEFIRFSPFGRTDRAAGGAGHEGAAAPGNYPQPQEVAAGVATMGFAGGAAKASAPRGQGGQPDEEEIPF